VNISGRCMQAANNIAELEYLTSVQHESAVQCYERLVMVGGAPDWNRTENLQKLKFRTLPIKWLRHCATNQKVAGSISDEVNF
jgi:hypothetical protein